MKTSNGVNKFPRQQSIFWIETDKIKPNSTQPRESFKEESLRGLADSIRQYGVLQPLVVTRREIEVPSGTVVEYELIAGERRLRASKMAELNQVPVIIREDEGEKVRLELAIIENLQREDLNPLEKARAFKKLIDSFNLKHHEIATKIGKSREYISNSLRILGLPEEIQRGLSDGAISEGHTRPLLMLSDRPQEQITLYKEIIYKKISVREAERISRSIAKEKARKKNFASDQETRFLEEKLSEKLGTRVQIEKTGSKGKIHIDFFSEEELRALLDKMIEDDSQDSDEISEKDDLRNILYDEPINPFESEEPDDEDKLAQNFTI
ncbi:MAG: ParB/RepB/Spo0J family partition protein [Patescibacteria group bacterium]